MLETEFAMLLLGVGVLAVAATRAGSLRRLHHWQLLAVSYLFLLVGWSATVLEAFGGMDVLYVLEHASYAVGALLAAVWCWLGPRHLEEDV